MLERGLISMDGDPHSSPSFSPPQKTVSRHALSTRISSHHLQDYHDYKNLQPSLPITADNEQHQPKDLKSILPTQSLLKTSLLCSSSTASLTSLSSSSSLLTAKPTLTSMQFQETKKQSQHQCNITELPIQQYNSILHSHLMSKQASTSSTSALSAGCTLTTSTSVETFSASGTASITNNSISPNHQQHKLHLNQHNTQMSQPVKQKQQNQPHLMQEIAQQQRKTSSPTLTATLLPHFVISPPSSTSCYTNNSNNNVSKNNFNCINDVSNNLTFNSLSSNNSSSNRNINKSNSYPKNSTSSYQVQSMNAVCSMATTSTVTTQTDDVAVVDRKNIGMSENNARLQMIPSSGVTMEPSILNSTSINSVAGGNIIRRRPSNHHEAVTVVVFKTLLPDD